MNELMGIRVASSKRENPTLAGRDYWLMGLMLVALMGLTISSVFVGSRDIPYAVTFDALFHFDEQNTQHLLVHYLRVPRTGLAILVGAALGAAGVIMQAMTRNPLADPGIFGCQCGRNLDGGDWHCWVWSNRYAALFVVWLIWRGSNQCGRLSAGRYQSITQSRSSGAGWCGDDGGALVYDSFDYAQ